MSERKSFVLMEIFFFEGRICKMTSSSINIDHCITGLVFLASGNATESLIATMAKTRTIVHTHLAIIGSLNASMTLGNTLLNIYTMDCTMSSSACMRL